MACRWYQKAAESGDAVGQFYLGCFLFHTASRTEGAAWIRRAAAQDYAPALYWDAVLGENGHGVEVDICRSRASMKRAAELGHPYAMTRLAKQALRGADGFSGVVWGLRQILKVPAIAFRLADDNTPDRNLREG